MSVLAYQLPGGQSSDKADWSNWKAKQVEEAFSGL